MQARRAATPALALPQPRHWRAAHLVPATAAPARASRHPASSPAAQDLDRVKAEVLWEDTGSCSHASSLLAQDAATILGRRCSAKLLTEVTIPAFPNGQSAVFGREASEAA